MVYLYWYDSLSLYHWLVKYWDDFQITDIWIIDAKLKKKLKFNVSLIKFIRFGEYWFSD